MPSQPDSKTKVPELEAFGEEVRRHRMAAGYTQEAFGLRCGIDRGYMGGIERGETNVGFLTILKITDALGLLPSEFIKSLDRLRISPIGKK